MAISKKKMDAIVKLTNAENEVAKYRGIMEYSFSWKPYRNMTIACLNSCTEKCLALLNEELPAASEKQLNFLNILLDKDYNISEKDAYNAAIAEGKTLNKWQGIELINILKTNENYIYGNYPNIGQRDFEELEERALSIISMMK